jgi:GcrA cell cycle regulator
LEFAAGDLPCLGINQVGRTLHARKIPSAHAADLYMSTAPKKVRRPKTLLDLEANDCRWPVGEPRHPDFHFCGEPQACGRPYCEHHWSMAFQPARPRQRPQPQSLVILPPPAAKAA